VPAHHYWRTGPLSMGTGAAHTPTTGREAGNPRAPISAPSSHGRHPTRYANGETDPARIGRYGAREGLAGSVPLLARVTPCCLGVSAGPVTPVQPGTPEETS